MLKSAKARKFVSCFLGEANGDARRAATMAGYKADNYGSIKSKASQLLKENLVAIKAGLDEVSQHGVAVLQERVLALQNRWDRMKELIEARATAPEMQAVTGGTTGLLVHNVKSIGSGEYAERVDLYEVDAGLLREMRELEKQAAIEMGQWTEKKEHSGAVQFNPITLEGDKTAADDDENG
jgi:hypothetical protein